MTMKCDRVVTMKCDRVVVVDGERFKCNMITRKPEVYDYVIRREGASPWSGVFFRKHKWLVEAEIKAEISSILESDNFSALLKPAEEVPAIKSIW